MGSSYSADNASLDPVTGLTLKENKLIQTSYNKIMENPIENGMTIMTKLFEKQPNHKKLFPFRDVPHDKLKDNVNFKVHCNRIMYNLKEIIDNLGNNEIVLATLDKLARNHKEHKATPEGFRDLEVVMLDIIHTLFSVENHAAWKKLLDVATGYITQQL